MVEELLEVRDPLQVTDIIPRVRPMADAIDPGVLPDLLASGSDAPAVRAPEDSRALTYRELTGAVEELATELAALGVERGDRVALALPAGPEFVELLLAIAALGAAAAPLNPAYTEPEFSFYLEDLRPRALAPAAGELAPRRQAAQADVTVVDVTFAPGGRPELSNEGTRPPARVVQAPTPDDVALLLHTSGTTSRPKQVPLRHRNLMASARAIARHYELSADDVSYCAMPLFHVHGLVASTLAQLAAGGHRARPAPRRRRRDSGRTLAEHGVTWYSASPTLHQMLLERAPGGVRRDAPALRRARAARRWRRSSPRGSSASSARRCSRRTG